MANYIKPGISFLAISSSTVAASSCATKNEDIEMLEAILGISFSDPNIFGLGESCPTQIDFQGYCKFTSVENGSMMLFYS